MRSGKRLGVIAAVVAAGALALPGGPATAAVPSASTPNAYTCTGGEIPSDTYASVTVTGNCSVPEDAVINVIGNLNVAAGARLDAHSAPSTITVGRNVTAGAGSFLALGCQPPSFTGNSGHACYSESDPPQVRTTITVEGNVTAIGADTVLLNGMMIEGNVTLVGGGGEIPWAIKNNTIGRNLTVNGQVAEWLGVLFNKVGGNATLVNITVTEDHEGASHTVYVVRNTIERNLTCMGLDQGASAYGNMVGRNAIGQCAPEA